MTKKRKAIPKKTRFNVFKRDSFTCQYCGVSAPDVILHIDHILPVSKGGTNKLTNLVTSCINCNLGKSDKTLNDDSAVKKQMNQLKHNQDRIEQIKMIAQWASMQSLRPEIDQLNKTIKQLNGQTLSDYGVKWAKKLIKKHGFSNLINWIYEAYDLYGDDYLEKVDSLINYKNSFDDDRHWMYSVGILRNRLSYYDGRKSSIALTKAKANGLTKDEYRQLVLTCRNWSEYMGILEEYNY